MNKIKYILCILAVLFSRGCFDIKNDKGWWRRADKLCITHCFPHYPETI